MNPLAIIAAIHLGSASLACFLAAIAPAGWEDEHGFHFGADPRVKFHSIHSEASNL